MMRILLILLCASELTTLDYYPKAVNFCIDGLLNVGARLIFSNTNTSCTEIGCEMHGSGRTNKSHLMMALSDAKFHTKGGSLVTQHKLENTTQQIAN